MQRSRNADDAEIGDPIRGFLVMQARAATDENRPLGHSVHPKGTCVRGRLYTDTAENGFGDSKPIGGVNRMRALAVAASREARLNRPRPEE